MNSDSDSDWDSMSEASPITSDQSRDNNPKYPPQIANITETRKNSIPNNVWSQPPSHAHNIQKIMIQKG